jgi:cell wall assembly regulator SMI1
MTDIVDQSIADLEVSVRTAAFLQSLNVTTLGALLSLPRIVAPHRLILGELEMLFDDLGVTYSGELEGPTLGRAALKAGGSIEERWATIGGWLKSEYPDALSQFRKPATQAAILNAEKKLGVTLPDDYKQFLALHNGQEEFAPMVGFGALFAIEEVAEAHANIVGDETPVDVDEAGEGVRPLDYCKGWIPISRSARGRDYLCIDLDPAKGGTRGQIIEYVVDSNARSLVAKSFADLLSLYFQQAQTGELDLDGDETVEDDD